MQAVVHTGNAHLIAAPLASVSPLPGSQPQAVSPNPVDIPAQPVALAIAPESECIINDDAGVPAIKMTSVGGKAKADLWCYFPPCTSVTSPDDLNFEAVIGGKSLNLTRNLATLV